MRLNRFLGKFDPQSKSIEITDKEIVKQVKNVLRMQIGSKFLLFDMHSNEALVKIDSLSSKSIFVKVLEMRKNINEPGKEVLLYCSILKKENFELVVQKATEIGIREIIPLITKNTVKLNIKNDRLEKIIKEAAEQSGRGILPTLRKPMNFHLALESAQQNDANFIFQPESPLFDSKALRSGQSASRQRIGVFIGPEGGWDYSEIDSAKTKDFKIAGLGKFSLRAETAAIVASYLLVN